MTSTEPLHQEPVNHTKNNVNRRSGMLLDEDFDVFSDQERTDKDLEKQTLAGKVFLDFSCLYFHY